MSEEIEIKVGQVWEDDQPIYDVLVDEHGRRRDAEVQRRRLRVTKIETGYVHMWCRSTQRYTGRLMSSVVCEVIRDTQGNTPAKPRKVKIRADRLLKKGKNGYRLVEEAG